MEKEQIKIYLERMHKHYLEFVNEYTKDYNQFKDYKGTALTEFYSKKTSEYTNKADAILNVIEFITEAELKGY